MNNLKSKGKIYCDAPTKFLLVGEWEGNRVTVEYEKKIFTFETFDDYPGKCLCWIRNYKNNLPRVISAIKLK